MRQRQRGQPRWSKRRAGFAGATHDLRLVAPRHASLISRLGGTSLGRRGVARDVHVASEPAALLVLAGRSATEHAAEHATAAPVRRLFAAAG